MDDNDSCNSVNDDDGDNNVSVGDADSDDDVFVKQFAAKINFFDLDIGQEKKKRKGRCLIRIFCPGLCNCFLLFAQYRYMFSDRRW